MVVGKRFFFVKTAQELEVVKDCQGIFLYSLPRLRTHKGEIAKEKGKSRVKGQEMEMIKGKALEQISRYFPKAGRKPRVRRIHRRNTVRTKCSTTNSFGEAKEECVPKFCRSWRKEARMF
jgi:hypothetical protein